MCSPRVERLATEIRRVIQPSDCTVIFTTGLSYHSKRCIIEVVAIGRFVQWMNSTYMSLVHSRLKINLEISCSGKKFHLFARHETELAAYEYV